MSWIEDRNEIAFENAERDWEEPPDDDVVTFCDWCGNEVYEGDYLTDVNGDSVCDECLAKWVDHHRYKVTSPDEPDNSDFENEYEEYCKQHDEGDER